MEKKRVRMNKKGAEMTIGTIIVIILALVVLVVVIYGFMTGWGNLWGKITGLTGSGKANVQINVDSCKLACSSNAQSDYCIKVRNITFEDNKPTQPLTCSQLASQYGPNIGLDPCANIDCNTPINPSSGTCASFKAAWQKTPCATTQKEVPLTSITNAADKGDNTNCCKTSCETLHGTWSNSACASGYDNKYDSLTDKEEGKDPTTTSATNCCLMKITPPV